MAALSAVHMAAAKAAFKAALVRNSISQYRPSMSTQSFGQLRCLYPPRHFGTMDSILNAASAISSLLSLTVQITQVMQRHICGVASLPRAVATYLEELVCLKKLLVDVQDTLLL
jgi:hypothetical protein